MDGLPRKLGIIAGNGEFPLMVLAECRRQGIETAVAAIKDETEPVVIQQATEAMWMGVGQLGRLIRWFRARNIHTAVMAGQVRHVRIFGKDRPDLRMMALLARLPRKNTDSLLGAIADELSAAGIQLMDSTLLLQDMVPREGVLSQRKPNRNEQRNIEYGRFVAREIARLDLGQTIVVRDQAVVAVEAMEGTDETIRRAAGLSHGKHLTVIKVSKPNQDMRFDVPVMGIRTVEVLRECGVTAMAIDAERSLIFHKNDVLKLADEAGIALVALPPAD